MVAYSACALAFSVALFGFAATSLSHLQQAHRILDPLREMNVPVATYRCLESSWVFYADRPIHELATSEASADLPKERIRFWERKPRLLPAEFARRHPEAFFITTDRAWPELQRQLPGEYRILDYAPYFLRNDNLLLAGPAETVRMATAVREASRR
jgi:hypothetical protein